MKTNIKMTAGIALAVGTVITVIMAGTAFAAARITPAQAKAAAIKKIPGKAQSAKYEFEDGHWQYAVIVVDKAQMYEVEVSAATGKVTDTEKTSAAEEASEAAADKKAAMKSAGAKPGTTVPSEEKGEQGEKDETGK